MEKRWTRIRGRRHQTVFDPDLPNHEQLFTEICWLFTRRAIRGRGTGKLMVNQHIERATLWTNSPCYRADLC